MNAQYRINKHNKKAYHRGLILLFLLPAYLKRIEAVIVSVPPTFLFISIYRITQQDDIFKIKIMEWVSCFHFETWFEGYDEVFYLHYPYLNIPSLFIITFYSSYFNLYMYLKVITCQWFLFFWYFPIYYSIQF